LDISFRIATAGDDRNDVIELQSLSGTTPDTLAFVSSPHEQSHVLGDWLAGRSVEAVAILQSFYFSPHLFDAPLTA
jgi:hypothetical protein